MTESSSRTRNYPPIQSSFYQQSYKKDFRSPRRVLTDVQDGFNRKGLISNRGIRKAAFYELQEWYSK